MDWLDRSRQTLAVSLASLAGFVDAIGFLSADGYFVSFMSGNTTRLAVNLAQDPLRALVPALLIGGFVTGVAGGTMVALRTEQHRKAAVLGLVALLLLGGALARWQGHDGLSLAGLALAMGALNTTFQRNGEVALGLTYMTGALVKLGQAIGAALSGERRSGWGAYLMLWSGLAGGAALGALAFLHAGAIVIWAASLWAALLAVAARRLDARPAA